MDRVAKETGGQHIDAATTDPTTYFHQTAEELRSSYELAYYPSNPIRDNTFRKIAIRPKQTGVTVRSRTGYFLRSAEWSHKLALRPCPCASWSRSLLPPSAD